MSVVDYILENSKECVKMNGTGSNIYAKQYLVNYRILSSSEKRKRRRCDKEVLVPSDDSEELFIEDMNKNSDCGLEQYRSQSGNSSFDSQITKSINNLEDSTEVVQTVSKKRLHFKEDVTSKEPKTKKVKHDCFELEEVNDTGQCSEVNSDDAIENSDEDKNEEISEDMEMFNDLTDDIDYVKWLAKVVAHDHDYYGQRVRFSGVTVWYFARHQYSSSVPSEGDVGLGMEMTHLHREHHDIDKSDSDHISFSHKLKGRRRNRPGRLKPLSMSARVSMLRSHGIYQIDRGESATIEHLQVLNNIFSVVTIYFFNIF